MARLILFIILVAASAIVLKAVYDLLFNRKTDLEKDLEKGRQAEEKIKDLANKVNNNTNGTKTD